MIVVDTRRLDRFLASVQQLTPTDFVTVSEGARATGTSVRTSARKAAKLSAADRSALDKRVRDAFVPMLGRFHADPSADLHDAIMDTMTAALGVVQQAKLSEEQYGVLTHPFIIVGAEVPPWAPGPAS
ncbi:hypothetical protein [Agromyces cerinus]|uniref:Uncharacterized protein n=1 Tax=Agromyces cerinus subsp. cerinus TaxID=232089 RepID=A0A1N6FCN9_9MICO|nr:hypothetical protein [Agromyces cerinus]SIN93053.1 hypothetical protein SAMN05443544_1937 [Agromyces cerinus subsp. cerinus]